MYSQNHLKKLLKIVFGASLVAQLVKNPTAVEENPVRSLGREDPREVIGYRLQCSWASLVAQLVKNPPAMQETWVHSSFCLFLLIVLRPCIESGQFPLLSG